MCICNEWTHNGTVEVNYKPIRFLLFLFVLVGSRLSFGLARLHGSLLADSLLIHLRY